MLDRLQQRLGYRFKDETLLQKALTHRSVGSNNNERLEFLGDAILGMVIAESLFQQYPEEREGALSRRRASIVKGESLAVVARMLNLGEFIKLGPGELKSGGFRRDSILADAVEAILAAIYLDSEINTVRKTILTLFESLIDSSMDPALLKDPKTRLQEYLQSRKIDLPIYEVISISGKDHNQLFQVSCCLASLNINTKGEGGSRRQAEQQAAEKALDEIK
ncbi:ribonuclease III [Solemya pervernicosa gill symbiont]|uniref:Ribonuclease 3 n=2 Tax=Gammaproteobacteria incertae sedis TaxID=118884 RepID=A0A1T2LA90_9GAMM|nr:ribonuclease III [Candidatus Reidiella endopervernicosa]OOZ42028.1 ribonuclease III [Solemya pervernicosa gill symbiont]QKQ28265.1 ribonuclease III [Candidatus Reidiella endopervernicosa]